MTEREDGIHGVGMSPWFKACDGIWGVVFVHCGLTWMVVEGFWPMASCIFGCSFILCLWQGPSSRKTLQYTCMMHLEYMTGHWSVREVDCADLGECMHMCVTWTHWHVQWYDCIVQCSFCTFVDTQGQSTFFRFWWTWVRYVGSGDWSPGFGRVGMCDLRFLGWRQETWMDSDSMSFQDAWPDCWCTNPAHSCTTWDGSLNIRPHELPTDAGFRIAGMKSFETGCFQMITWTMMNVVWSCHQVTAVMTRNFPNKYTQQILTPTHKHLDQIEVRRIQAVG